MTQKTFILRGVDCPDCAGHVEKAVTGIAGVIQAKVLLSSSKLLVEFEDQAASSKVIRTIEKLGYRAQPHLQSLPWWQTSRVKSIAWSGALLLTAFLVDISNALPVLVNYLYGASILAGGYYPVKLAIAGLKARTLNIYTLLVFAAGGAVFLGYINEAALLVFVYTWGAVMETYAVEKARMSLKKLNDMLPAQALVKNAAGVQLVPVENIEPGDIIVVKPGQRVPLDGEVAAGFSILDQSPVTGESMPVYRAENDPVFAGSINQHGYLEIRVTRLAAETTLARVVGMVERAESKKSSYQRFAEKFGRIYTPAMFVVAVIVAVVPWLAGQPFEPWLYRSLVVLVVSCSCGLVLSVPISVLATVSAAARKGVLIKGGADIEAAGKIDAVVFDKTGTLTLGKTRVKEIVCFDTLPADLLSIAASVESRSEHPLADAITKRAREEGVVYKPVKDFEVKAGFGAKGVIEGKKYIVGSEAFCKSEGIDTSQAGKKFEKMENRGMTVVVIAGEEKVLGLIGIADALRPEASEAVTRLRSSGIKHLVMFTGDNPVVARAIASQAGLDEFRSQLLPEDKVAELQKLKNKYHWVAFVGDGINDAPAMAAADIGIAMGAGGTDIAVETADLALMSDDLLNLPLAFDISRRAVRVIRQNVALSLSIVLLVVTLALTGNIGLVPGLLINEGGALLVMANGLRLLRI